MTPRSDTENLCLASTSVKLSTCPPGRVQFLLQTDQQKRNHRKNPPGRAAPRDSHFLFGAYSAGASVVLLPVRPVLHVRSLPNRPSGLHINQCTCNKLEVRHVLMQDDRSPSASAPGRPSARDGKSLPFPGPVSPTRPRTPPTLRTPGKDLIQLATRRSWDTSSSRSATSLKTLANGRRRALLRCDRLPPSWARHRPPKSCHPRRAPLAALPNNAARTTHVE